MDRRISSLQTQADACQVEAQGIRAWVEALTGPTARRKTSPEELALLRHRANALDDASVTLRRLHEDARAALAAIVERMT